MAQVPDTNPTKDDSETPMMQDESDYFNSTDHPLNESAQDYRPRQLSQLYGREIPYRLRLRGDKVKTGSWKVKQAGSWKEIIRNAGRTSNRSRRIKGRRKAEHRFRDPPGVQDADTVVGDHRATMVRPNRPLQVEDFQRTFYGHEA